MQISKSEFLMFLKYPALIWYKKHDKSKIPPIDDNLQAIFDAGNLFETYAEKLFDDGIRVGWSIEESNYGSMPARTAAALKDGAKTIFQGRFQTPDLTCICDVIEIDGKTIDLYEIKSGTSVKQENIYDLAFQTHVLELCGYEVRDIAVISVNGSYVRKGAINPRELCNIDDVTSEVRDVLDDVVQWIGEAQELVSRKTPPEMSPPADDSNLDAWLEFYLYNNPQEPGSIFDLIYPKNRIAQLYEMGITKIVDIPDDFKLSPKQQLQVDATKTDEITADKSAIKEFLERLEFPLYFLDYETLSGVIPAFDGLSPYKQLPFQYSLHVMAEPGAPLEHYYYLHRDNSHPTIPLSESLAQHIGDSGTIVTWNERFEKTCNDLMGKVEPKLKKFYKEVNDRIDDLCIPFQKNHFIHKDFMGSYSIKKVLPVLCPDLSYKNLDINEGAGAQRMWMQSVLEGKHQEMKAKILDDLEKYCELDTFAMVRIYDFLVQLVDYVPNSHSNTSGDTGPDGNTRRADSELRDGKSEDGDGTGSVETLQLF